MRDEALFSRLKTFLRHRPVSEREVRQAFAEAGHPNLPRVEAGRIANLLRSGISEEQLQALLLRMERYAQRRKPEPFPFKAAPFTNATPLIANDHPAITPVLEDFQVNEKWRAS